MSSGVTDVTEQQLRNFFLKADKNKDYKLDKDEFAGAVREIAKRHSHPASRCFTLYNIWVFFVVSWFEMGTSFSLPAMGALAARMKFRFDLTETELGSLVGLYYLGVCQLNFLTNMRHSNMVGLFGSHHRGNDDG